MALTESQNTERLSRVPLGSLTAHLRAWLDDSSHRSIAQKVAGAAFVIRVFSAALIYLSQILFARWMGSFEFGIYVYVWTWVLLIGDLADLGLASGAQRFIPEYTSRKSFDLLRGFLSRSRWIAVASATIIALLGVGTVKLLQPVLSDYVVLPLMTACATLPFYALMQIQDGIARSYNWIHLALLPPYIVRHTIMLLLMAAAYLLSFPTNAETAVTAVGVSFALTVIWQTIVLNRKLKRTVEPGPKTHETKTWFRVSLPILMVEGFYLLLTNTDILVLQQFRSPEDVAHLLRRRQDADADRVRALRGVGRGRASLQRIPCNRGSRAAQPNPRTTRSAGRSGHRSPPPLSSWRWAGRCSRCSVRASSKAIT